jgi:hypothetical protein
MTSHSFVEAILAEDSKSRGKTTLEVFTLFVLVGKLWWPVQLSEYIAIYRHVEIRTLGTSRLGEQRRGRPIPVRSEPRHRACLNPRVVPFSG